MTTGKSAIQDFFVKLGLGTEIADLYISLQANGPQSISELSRSSNIERTRIYRLLSELKTSGLIEIESHYKRSIIKAAPIDNLRMIVDQRHNELSKLQSELESVQQALASNPASSPTTQIQYYQGAQGLRQILWNELRSTTEIIAYSYQIFDEGVGRPFMTNWVAEFERRNLRKKIMFNYAYVKSWHQRPGTRIKGVEYNMIDPSILAIGHTCNVYDNVTCYLNWKDGEVFGAEICNQDIANTQRQLLEGIWRQSSPETRF